MGSLFLAGLMLSVGAEELTIFAQAYTPEITTGDNPPSINSPSWLARRFERLHPGVKVSFIKNPLGDFRTWMITQLKGGAAPDIMWTHSTWANQDAQYGWFVRLDPYLSQPNPYVPGNKRWFDLFYADATNAKRAPDGGLYALPIDQVETGVFYNKDIFRRVGASPPSTWEEFLAVQDRLQQAGYIPFLMTGAQEMRITWARSILLDQLFDDLLPQIDVREAEGFPGVDAQEFGRAYKKGIAHLRFRRFPPASLDPPHQPLCPGSGNPRRRGGDVDPICHHQQRHPRGQSGVGGGLPAVHHGPPESGAPGGRSRVALA